MCQAFCWLFKYIIYSICELITHIFYFYKLENQQSKTLMPQITQVVGDRIWIWPSRHRLYCALAVMWPCVSSSHLKTQLPLLKTEGLDRCGANGTCIPDTFAAVLRPHNSPNVCLWPNCLWVLCSPQHIFLSEEKLWSSPQPFRIFLFLL